MHVVQILLVEDSKSDAVLTAETLSESRIVNQLHIVRDGAAAMDFLYQVGKYQNAPRPDLILLDLNLPKKNGREVLAEIKTDPHLKTIPVVVLTTSDYEGDILKSYELHANCYITKPVELSQFINMMKTLEHFWFTIVKLPLNQSW
jgi:chemotaxis family two-component system response regulator Rcp1